MKSPMQRRLWVTYILFFLAPIVFMATVGYMYLSRIMTDKAGQEYLSMLNHNAVTLENYIRRLNDVSNQFARTTWIERIVNQQGDSLDFNRVTAFDLNQYHQNLVAIRESLSPVHELGIIFPRVDFVVATYGNSDFDFLINNAMRVRVLEAYDWLYILDNLVPGQPVLFPGVLIERYGIAQEKLLYFKRIQPAGSIRSDAIVFATIRVADINRHLGLISFYGQNNITVSDANDNVFAYASADIMGTMVGIYYTSGFTGWHYALHVPQAVILGGLMQVRNILLAFTISLLFVCGVISFTFSKRLPPYVRIRDSYISTILAGVDSDEDAVLSGLADIGINLNRQFFQVGFLMRRSFSGTPLPSLTTDKLEITQGKAVVFAKHAPSGYVLLFNYDSKNHLADIVTTLMDKVPDGTLALGGETESLKDVAVSCQRAVTISRYRYFMDGYRLIRYEDHAAKMGLYYYPFEKEYTLGNLLANEKRAEAQTLINDLVKDNTRREEMAPDGVRNLLVNVAMNIARTENSAIEILPINQLVNMTVEELLNYVHQAVETICQTDSSETGQNTLYIRMTEYVDTALRTPELSLTMVADAFGVSPSFVSKIFKEMGKHFHTYINEQRISLAKPLLMDTNLTILAIAKEVGYDNDITFRRQFKQFTGTTPKTYRESKTGGV